jgi:hypothetical protein
VPDDLTRRRFRHDRGLLDRLTESVRRMERLLLALTAVVLAAGGLRLAVIHFGDDTPSRPPDGTGGPASTAPPATPSGPGKARITKVGPADGQDGLGSELVVEVTVDEPPARAHTLFLLAYLPRQGATVPNALHVAKATVPTDRGTYRIPVTLGGGEGSLGLVRRFQVISADPSAAAVLRDNLAHQFDPGHDAKRRSLPDGALILDSSDPVTRTRA